MDAKLKQSMTDLIQAINKSGDEAVERAKAGVPVISMEAYEPPASYEPPGVTTSGAAKLNSMFAVAADALPQNRQGVSSLIADLKRGGDKAEELLKAGAAHPLSTEHDEFVAITGLDGLTADQADQMLEHIAQSNNT